MERVASPGGELLQARVAFLATAMAAFAVAVSTPLMRISGIGRSSEATLPGSAIDMWWAGSPVAAILVALFTIILPGAFIALSLAAGVGAMLGGTQAWARLAGRFAHMVSPWSMPEVMLLAALVAYVKVSELADATPGLGMYATGALALLLALGRGAVRIRHTLRRAPALESIGRTVALLAAALVCYVPAMVLPVLVTTVPGSSEADTILDGVQALQRSGSWVLALIVLAASVMIPVAKIAVLGYLCVVARLRLPTDRRAGARMLRILKVVGRWSMLDVFVDAFVVALIQVPPLMFVRPGPGVPFFAATAVLTMLASMSFDPRLLRRAV